MFLKKVFSIVIFFPKVEYRYYTAVLKIMVPVTVLVIVQYLSALHKSSTKGYSRHRCLQFLHSNVKPKYICTLEVRYRVELSLF
jgi:cell division protein FtsW (lipid II flippase)